MEGQSKFLPAVKIKRGVNGGVVKRLDKASLRVHSHDSSNRRSKSLVSIRATTGHNINSNRYVHNSLSLAPTHTRYDTTTL